MMVDNNLFLWLFHVHISMYLYRVYVLLYSFLRVIFVMLLRILNRYNFTRGIRIVIDLFYSQNHLRTVVHTSFIYPMAYKLTHTHDLGLNKIHFILLSTWNLKNKFNWGT